MSETEAGGKFLGWVVEYANVCGYPGLPAYLLISDWHNPNPKLAFSLATATVFGDEDVARLYADSCKDLLAGDKSKAAPSVRPLWSITQLTTSNPNATFADRFHEVVPADFRQKLSDHAATSWET